MESKWQLFETAPKDGSWFLVIENDSDMVYAPYELAFWDGAKFSPCDVSEEIDFDYWMPLPEPPKQ